MSNPDPVADRASPTPQYLPPQIQRQVDRARELEASQRAATSGTPPAEPPAEPPAAEPPAQPAGPAPLVVAEQDLPQLIRLADYTAADPVRETDASYWKQRFMIADGIAKKTRQTNDEIRTLREENERLKSDVATLKARPAAPTTPVADDIDLLAVGFTQEQIDEYGADFLKTQIRANQAVIDKSVEAQVKPIKEREEKANQTAEQQRKDELKRKQQEFLDALAALIPEWKQIDDNPLWRDWLSKENDKGVVRQVILDAYIGQRSAERTASMFKEWLTLSGAREVPPPPPPLPPSGAPEQAPSGGPTNMQQAPFPMTKKGYKQWKSTLARAPGQLWRGNKELTAQIEARYNAAIAQNTLP